MTSQPLLLAWAGVGVFCASLVLSIYVASPPDDGDASALEASWSPQVHQLGLAAWLVIVLVTSTNLVFLETRRCRTALLLLLSAAFWIAGYAAAVAGSGQVWLSGSGPTLFYPMRYVAWLQTSLGISLALWWPTKTSLPMLAASLLLPCALVASVAGLRLCSQAKVLPAAIAVVVSLAGTVFCRFASTRATSALLARIQAPHAATAVLTFFWMDSVLCTALVALDVICHFGGLSVLASEASVLCAGVLGHVSLLSATSAGAFPTPGDCRALEDEAERLVELEQASIKKDRYMAVITHELRTPLNGIIGLLDSLLLGDANSMDAKHRKSLVTVRDTGKRLNKLIGTILDHASMQEEKLRMAHERVNVHKVISETSQLIKPLLSPDARLSLEVADSLPLLSWDTNRLTQVMFNLMGNAAKFCQEGTVTVKAAFEGSHMEISVTDEGIGIPKDKLDTVFNPFEQVDDVQGRNFGGTGLGLSMAKKLVEAQGGTIAVSSTIGSGTTFTIKLPCTEEKGARKSIADDGSAKSIRGTRPVPQQSGAIVKGRENKTGMRDILSQWISKHKEDTGSWMTPGASIEGMELEVLSVDDDPVNQNVMDELMTASGFKVTIAMDGQEALDILVERLQNNRPFPDIIFMDLMMPKITGLETTKIIRKTYPSSNVPIIMVSANDDEESIVQGLQNGCNDYINKPFNRMELIARAGLQIRMLQYYNKEMESWQHEQLLQELLPQSVIDRLKMGQTTIADELPEVSVVMTDIVGFTNVAASASTPEIIGMLDRLFSDFDAMSEIHGVEKIETRGDSYLVLAGHDEATKHDHVARTIRMAMDMIKAASQVKTPSGEPLRIRLGINSGPAYAGIVGHKCPRYCLFGDTVNTASRMESHGFPMCIQISDATYKLAAKTDIHGSVKFTDLGVRNIKGKHQMRTWLVQSGDWKNALARYLTDLPAEEEDEAPAPAAILPAVVGSKAEEKLDFLGLQVEELLTIVRSGRDNSPFASHAAAPVPVPLGASAESTVVIRELVLGMEGISGKLDSLRQDIGPQLDRIEELSEHNRDTVGEVALCSEACKVAVLGFKGDVAAVAKAQAQVARAISRNPSVSDVTSGRSSPRLAGESGLPPFESKSLTKRRASLVKRPLTESTTTSVEAEENKGVSFIGFASDEALSDKLPSKLGNESVFSEPEAAELESNSFRGRNLIRLRSRSLKERSMRRLTLASMAGATDAAEDQGDVTVDTSSKSSCDLSKTLRGQLGKAMSMGGAESMKMQSLSEGVKRRSLLVAAKSNPASPREGGNPKQAR